MINQIKIASSFASKDKSSIFNNVLVKDGFMTCQNGLNGISLQVDNSIDFCCNADKLRMSFNNCGEDMKLSIKKGKLYIQSGKFKSSIDIVDISSYPDIDVDFERNHAQDDIIAQLLAVSKFSDPNDVRIALQGVAIAGNKTYATNGHMAIIKTIEDTGIDEIIIPTKSIQMIAKSGFFVRSIGVKHKTVFFESDSGIVFSKTIEHKMPDINKIITNIENTSNLSDIRDDLKSIAPLCGDVRHVIIGDSIKTMAGDAEYGGYNYKESAFNVDYLLAIAEVAEIIDLSKYPNPCPFSGDGVKGAIVGVKI